MSFLKQFRQPYFKQPKIVLSKHCMAHKLLFEKTNKAECRPDYKCWLKGRFFVVKRRCFEV
jgi:hypothetical protein